MRLVPIDRAMSSPRLLWSSIFARKPGDDNGRPFRAERKRLSTRAILRVKDRQKGGAGGSAGKLLFIACSKTLPAGWLGSRATPFLTSGELIGRIQPRLHRLHPVGTAAGDCAMIYVLAALLPPLGLLLNGQPFWAIFNVVLIVFCLVFGLIFHVLLLVPSAHALLAVHMRREDRRHREVVEAIRRYGPPPGYQR
jgi:hypothetical protein